MGLAQSRLAWCGTIVGVGALLLASDRPRARRPFLPPPLCCGRRRQGVADREIEYDDLLLIGGQQHAVQVEAAMHQSGTVRLAQPVGDAVADRQHHPRGGESWGCNETAGRSAATIAA